MEIAFLDNRHLSSFTEARNLYPLITAPRRAMSSEEKIYTSAAGERLSPGIPEKHFCIVINGYKFLASVNAPSSVYFQDVDVPKN